MPTITIQNEGRTIEVEQNVNLRDALRKNGVSLYAGMSQLFNCHGGGMCGTCNVLVIAGAENLSERTPRETRKLKTYDRCSRLACQCAIIGDADITINTLSN